MISRELSVIYALLICAAHCSAGPVHDAVSAGDTAKVQDFLRSQPTLVSARGADGWTPLHFAASKANPSLCKLLLARGASINASDDAGRTPLHLAAETGSVETLRLLVGSGATVDSRTIGGWTPLFSAVKLGRLECVQFLIQRGADLNAKITSNRVGLGAKDSGKIGVVDRKDISLEARQGCTLLHIAAELKDLPITELLLKRGATVDAANAQGLTPLHVAARVGSLEIAKLLVNRGAKIDAADKSHYTPLHYACADGKTDMAQCLVPT
jgi:ankyrin repeat protein